MLYFSHFLLTFCFVFCIFTKVLSFKPFASDRRTPITFSLEFYFDDLLCSVQSSKFCFCHTSTRNAKYVIWYSDSLEDLSLANLQSEQKIENLCNQNKSFQIQSRLRDYEIPWTHTGIMETSFLNWLAVSILLVVLIKMI